MCHKPYPKPISAMKMPDLITISPDLAFAYEGVLYLLALPVLLVIWYALRHRGRTADIRYVHAEFAKGIRKSLRVRLRHLPFVLRILALSLIILAVARPQSSTGLHEETIEGIDIMMALDISGSMLAEDFEPNRMEAAKQTALDFIDMRTHDRIGMTVFSGESFTLSPLTRDHGMLKALAEGAGPGMVRDGTAIGDGLATAINRLRDSDAESRVIVLLTDGINNTGAIDPLTAADMAALFGIRVYTIGVGSSGLVPYPFETPMGIQYRDVEIPVDEDLLQEIADITGGAYYWAETQDALEQVYADIDELERTVIEVTEYARVSEKFLLFLVPAILLLFLEVILKYTWLRSVP